MYFVFRIETGRGRVYVLNFFSLVCVSVLCRLSQMHAVESKHFNLRVLTGRRDGISQMVLEKKKILISKAHIRVPTFRTRTGCECVSVKVITYEL